MAARARADPGPSRRPEQSRARPGTTPALGDALASLAAVAGNRATARLARLLQRLDYTTPQANVAGTGITRLEVHGLKFGVDGFAKSYGDAKSDASHERDKTTESPSHTAVVLVPDKLEPGKPVQVILQFHGWGFRSGDPYPGYLVAAKGSPSAPAGTVRDVDQEHWEQQIASLKGEGAQIVAILAQGRGKSDFGDFPTFEYVRDVLEKSGRPELVKLAEGENYSIVLSAHSGGGSTKVVPALGRGEAETADRGSLKAQVESKADGRVVNKLQPVDLVVLYEALNGDGDVNAVMRWVDGQLARLVPQLERDSATALAATPTLRGYYGHRKSGYRERYRWLACRIQEAIASRVPEKFRPDVADRFRIIEVTDAGGKDVEHEQVLSGTGAAGAGSIADALRAARDPQADRAQAVLPSAEECEKLKRNAKERAEEAAAAAKARAAKAGAK